MKFLFPRVSIRMSQQHMRWLVATSAVAIAALAGSFFSGWAMAQTPTPISPPSALSPLSLTEALRVAEVRSRTLDAQDAAAHAAREMAVAAGQRPDPTLKLGINNLPVDTADRFSLTRDFMTMRSVGIAQEITRSDKLKARTARFDREAEAAEASRAMALANLQRDTAIAWLDRYYQERMREVLKAQRNEATLQIEAADAAYRGGRGSQADVFAARSAVALIDNRIQQIEQQIATAKIRLARWIGTDAERTLAAAPNLAKIGIDANGFEAHPTSHPEIELMLKQEAVADAEADIAQSNKRSDWGAELMYSQRGPAFSNMVSLNFSIPLQLDQKDRQDREVAAKLAVAQKMRAQREEATREHLADLRSWLQQWHGNRDRLAQYDSAIIPLAAERTRAAIAAYRGGGGGSSSGGSGGEPLSAVLEARRMEIDTRLDRLRLEMETAVLWSQLEYLVPIQPDRPATTLTPTPMPTPTPIPAAEEK